MHSDGRIVPEVNEFFAFTRMRVCADGTIHNYAYALGMWLGYLDAAGRRRHEAGEHDVGGFKFWRMTDEDNPGRVTGGTVLGNLIAIHAFYGWAEPRYGVANPVHRLVVPGQVPGETVERYAAAPHVVRSRTVACSPDACSHYEVVCDSLSSDG